MPNMRDSNALFVKLQPCQKQNDGYQRQIGCLFRYPRFYRINFHLVMSLFAERIDGCSHAQSTVLIKIDEFQGVTCDVACQIVEFGKDVTLLT